MASLFRTRQIGCWLLVIIIASFWSSIIAQNNQGGNDQGEDESSGWDEQCKQICPENEECVNTGLSGGTENWECQCITGYTRNPAGECTIIKCPTPPRGNNVQVSGTSYTYLSTVTYSCDEGYMKTSGDVQIRCLENGIWSGPSITCSLTNCGAPDEGGNSQLSYTTTTYNSVATYRCNKGNVRRAGSATITCQSDSTWSDIPLYCVPENGCEISNPCKNGGNCEYNIYTLQKSCKCMAKQKGAFCEVLQKTPRKLGSSITIMNVPYNKAFEDPNSPEFGELASNITQDLGRTLSRAFPLHFQGIDIKSFSETPEGFLKADFDLNLNPEYQGHASVIRDMILNYLVEGQFLDPYFDRQYQILPTELLLDEPYPSPNKMTGLFVAMAMFIPVMVTICCFLALWFRRRTRRRMREEFEDDDSTTVTPSMATSYVMASRPVFLWTQRPTPQVYLPDFADEQSVQGNPDVQDLYWRPPRPASIHRPRSSGDMQFSWRPS